MPSRGVNATAPDASRSARRLVPGLVIAVLLGVAVTVGVSAYADGPKLLRALGGFPPGHLAAALGLAVCNYLIRWVRWHLYLREVDERVPVGASAWAFLVGLAMSVTPGKSGELVKAWLLRDRCGARVARVAPVVVVERYTDLVAILALASLGLRHVPGGRMLMAVGAALVVGFYASVMFSSVVARWVAGRLARMAGGAGPDGIIDAHATTRALVAPRPLLYGTALAVAAWFAECLAFMVVLRGLGVESVGVGGASFVYAAATLAGALSFLPGGLGATEAVMTALMRTLADPVTAGAATLVVRACTLWFAVVLGVVAFLVGRRGRSA